MTDAVKFFFEAWADGSAEKIAASVATDASYLDPRTPEPLIGPEAITDYVAMFAQHTPGAVADVTDLSETGPYIRATVAFKMPDGMAQSGQYFVDLDEDGKIARLIGFVGTGTAP